MQDELCKCLVQALMGSPWRAYLVQLHNQIEPPDPLPLCYSAQGRNSVCGHFYHQFGATTPPKTLLLPQQLCLPQTHPLHKAARCLPPSPAWDAAPPQHPGVPFRGRRVLGAHPHPSSDFLGETLSGRTRVSTSAIGAGSGMTWGAGPGAAAALCRGDALGPPSPRAQALLPFSPPFTGSSKTGSWC